MPIKFSKGTIRQVRYLGTALEQNVEVLIDLFDVDRTELEEAARALAHLERSLKRLNEKKADYVSLTHTEFDEYIMVGTQLKFLLKTCFAKAILEFELNNQHYMGLVPDQRINVKSFDSFQNILFNLERSCEHLIYKK